MTAEKPVSLVYNMDCVAGMREYPDKYFDLAVCDPPFGIGEDWKKRNKGRGYKSTSYKNDSISDEAYFDQLFRISRNQIIWGYNYYTQFLGSTNYLLCWDKQSNNNEVFMYSQFELAYTSFKTPARLISIPWDGYRMGKETGVAKIHPHQKPIELYSVIFSRYAKPGDKILDTHLGSGSSRIASHRMGFHFEAFELDKDYYEAQEKRFKQETAQLMLEL